MARIGAHFHVDHPLDEAVACGADAAQFFLGDPQGWKAPVIPGGDPAAVKDAFAAAGIDVYIHAPYVINVATSNNRIRIPSRKLLDQHLKAAASVGAKGLIVHGGHVTAGTDAEAGLENWRKAVERIERPLPMLIENTAGGDGAMARTLEAIARLWEAVAGAAPDNDPNLGFCLDTCHANSAGDRPRRRGRPDQGDHRPDRPGALQQLARRVRFGPGPARQHRVRDDRPRPAARRGPGRGRPGHLRDARRRWRPGRRRQLAEGESAA